MRIFLAGLMASLAAAPAAAETLVIQAGQLITDASQPASGPATITVSDGRIVSIAPGLVPAPAGAQLIDLKDKTVLPGLVDLHVHLQSNPGGDYREEAVTSDEFATLMGARNARLTVKAGFTTVRDLGSTPQGGFALRDATAQGVIPGPRIIASGPAISIIGGHGDVSGFRPDVAHALDAHNTCTGPIECAARVREFSKAGADVIKITATGGVLSQQGRGLGQHFTDPELKAIVDTAHSLGLRVAAHAHGARGVEAAAHAGVDTAEHATFADLNAAKAMKQSGTAMVPTLMALAGVKARLGQGIYTPTVEVKAREAVAQMGRALKTAKAEGVTIGFGTDAGVFEHGRNAGEFALMVDWGGLTPREALASATTTAARLLNLDTEIGRIAPGYSADIIAVDGNPLTDVRTLEHVRFVMARGRIID
ncbi:MAG: amidohydrolase family protein [Chakrabartia sp.]